MDDVNWKSLCEQNPDIFVISEWNVFSEEKRKKWHLPSQYSYLQAGDFNLRVGVIAVKEQFKEEDFLLAGVIFASKIGNGARTVIYFVAPEFDASFLKAISQIGGSIIAKAVYWRRRLTPSVFLVRNYNKVFDLKHRLYRQESDWETWEKMINPVDWNNLMIIKKYFNNLARRRVRIVMKKKQILFCWGNLEIAEVKAKGNKIEMATKLRWTRNRNIVLKFQKTGWIDIAGNINEEFCRAVNGIIDLFENMEMSGSLDTRERLANCLIYDRDAVKSLFGEYIECPWIVKERELKLFDVYNLYFYQKDNNEINIVMPIIEKPMHKIVCALLTNAILSFSGLNYESSNNNADFRWKGKIYMLSLPEYKEEIYLCSQWLKETKQFPVIFLPDNWREEGLKGLKEYKEKDERVFN